MPRFDSMNPTPNADPLVGTITDELDRVEVKVGKIGMNSAEQAFAVLTKLDEISLRMQDIANEQSRKITKTEFDAITTRIRREAGGFIRDLGGAGALRSMREKVQPPAQNWWWFLDEIVVARRKAAIRRNLIAFGSAAVVMVILSIIYQVFLAPDPAFAARYAQERNTQDLMMDGQYERALEEAEKGLTYVSSDPSLLIYKGVLLEVLGRTDESQQDFAAAQALIENWEDFLVTRAQAYSMVDQMEKARTDVDEAIELNPDFAQAHLLSGQINESTGNMHQALTDYENAYAAAEKSRNFELAAIARTRTAMLMQLINTRIDFPTEEP
jgi:tetratricopeptide (TPR) repeat protein